MRQLNNSDVYIEVESSESRDILITSPNIEEKVLLIQKKSGLCTTNVGSK